MKIAFVGTGTMGGPMVANLVRKNFAVTAYDVGPAALDRAVKAGATAAGSAADAARGADLVVTMLPSSSHVERAYLGTGGVAEGVASGTLCADMSTIDPAMSRRVAEALRAKGVRFIDAPVSGGVPKAIDGTLAIMVGGKPEVFERVRPILEKMGSSVTLTGPVGAGNVTKLANQIMVACNIAAMGEALVLATRAGLDPEVVFNAVKGGLAGSTVLNAKAPMVIDRNFKPGFRINLHQKDLRNALLAAESMKVSLPFTSLVQQMLMALMNQGKGPLDHSAIVTFIEQMAGVEVKKAAAAQAP